MYALFLRYFSTQFESIQLNTSTIRVFVSSTFSDFQAERAILQDTVFPRLRERCEQHGLQFQAVDLRWGVSEQAGKDHKTMDICLDEVRRCQQVSPKPNFIALLGNRFGWRPAPARISTSTFDKLLAVITSADDSAFVEACYPEQHIDHNAVPPQRLLKAAFSSASAQDEGDLWRILAHCKNVFADDPMTHEWFDLSATGLELFVAALDPNTVGDEAGQVSVFERVISGLPQNAAAAGYRDMQSGAIDPDSTAALEQLKTRLSAQLGPEHYQRYEETWLGSEQLSDMLNPEITHGGFEQFALQIYHVLAKAIDEQIASVAQVNLVTREAQQHTRFGQERSREFVGRAHEHSVVNGYLSQAHTDKPLIITGASGSGKSAFLASVVHRLQHNQQAYRVVALYIGITSRVSSARTLVAHLWDSIGCHGSMPEQASSVRAAYTRALSEESILLVLDAIDQLPVQDARFLLDCLPEQVPAPSRILLSCIDDKIVAYGLTGTSPDILALTPLPVEDGEQLITAWLREAPSRALTQEQRNHLLSAWQAAQSCPLYLRIAVTLARRWTSATPLPILPTSTQGLISAYYEHLTTQWGHGSLLVQQTLSLLAASRSGLTEEELLAMLSANEAVMNEFRRLHPKSPDIARLPDIIWSRLYFDLAPFLTESTSQDYRVLRYFHRQFYEVSDQNYLQGAAGSQVHMLLANYFQKRTHDDKETVKAFSPRLQRGLFEFPWQLLKAQAYNELAIALTTPSISRAISERYFIGENGLIIHSLSTDIVFYWSELRKHGYVPRDYYLRMIEKVGEEVDLLDIHSTEVISDSTAPAQQFDIAALITGVHLTDANRILLGLGEQEISIPSYDHVNPNIETFLRPFLRIFALFNTAIHVARLMRSIKVAFENDGFIEREDGDKLIELGKQLKSERAFVQDFIDEIAPVIIANDEVSDDGPVDLFTFEAAAQCLFILNEDERAISLYRKVVERLRDSNEFPEPLARARVNFAGILGSKGDFSLAFEQLRLALEWMDGAKPVGHQSINEVLLAFFVSLTDVSDSQLRDTQLVQFLPYWLKHTDGGAAPQSLTLCALVQDADMATFGKEAVQQLQQLLSTSLMSIITSLMRENRNVEAQCWANKYLPTYRKIFGQEHAKTRRIEEIVDLKLV